MIISVNTEKALKKPNMLFLVNIFSKLEIEDNLLSLINGI